ncbi:MAG: hemolysin III family protein [Acidobacteriota bacterium]
MSEPNQPQTVREEIANSLSHGIGLLAAMAALPILVLAAIQREDVPGIVGASVFGTTMVLMYLTSTLYHTFPESRTKRVFQVLDHGAIFLLIAGTYTPFALGVLSGAWGWTLLGLEWGLAIVGVVMKIFWRVRFPRLSIVLYLIMGWLVLVAVNPLSLTMPLWGVFWLVTGGVAYTAGVVWYSAKSVRYNHLVWHLFVMLGTGCHFIAVLWYAA